MFAQRTGLLSRRRPGLSWVRPREARGPQRPLGRIASMDKRIVVVGAGAIGGYTGGSLAHNGYDVTLIDPWPEHVEAIRANGLSLEGVTPEESIVAHPKTLHLTEAQHLSKERPVDIAFISMKSYDTEWATLMIRQYLAPTGYVVSLQNCIN